MIATPNQTNVFAESESESAFIKQPTYAISSIESRIENNRSFYGSFFLGPFLPGQSLTIANAIRRTLLSDLKGIAIVSVEIQGVLHEYSSIPGVRDSVLDILLNMKEIVLKNKYSNSSSYSVFPQIGYLHVQGPGIVRAGDLKLPPFIQVVDLNQYIATLANDGYINMKFLISEGKSFMGKDLPSDNKQSDKNNTVFSVPYFTNHYNHLKKRNLLLKKIKASCACAFKKVSHSENQNLNNLSPKKDNNKQQTNRLDSLASKNSKPLDIDAVFSPITKVNYIIEYSEHKTIDNSFSKSQQIKDFLNLVKPLIATPNIALSETNASLSAEKNINVANLEGLHVHELDGTGESALTHTDGTLRANSRSANSSTGPSVGAQTQEVPLSNTSTNTRAGKKAASNSRKNEPKTNSNSYNYSIDEMVNLLADTGINSLSNSTSKNNNNKTFHNIVLEIWTNGSLHPKEALSLGLKELNQVISEIAGLQQILSTTQNFDLHQFKYDRNYQKLDLLLNSYTSYNFIPLNNSFYSSNYSLKYHKSFYNKQAVKHTETLQSGVNNKITLSLNPSSKNYNINSLTNTKKTENLIEKNLNDLDISNLNLSLAIYTMLKRSNINNIADLVTKTKKDLLLSTKLGLQAITDIEKSLFNMGLSLS
jgi:DNA-directed RNA polymerase alpha subunit